MSSQDPTPPDGLPITPAADAAPDPLWAPTNAQRRSQSGRQLQIGTPTGRPEPARAPYGQSASPTAAVRSTEVPRVDHGAGGPYLPRAEYTPRPSYEVPIVYEQPAVIVPPPRKSAWPWFFAVLALALGAAAGWLISRADDNGDAVNTDAPTTVAVDDTVPGELGIEARLDALVEKTRAAGAYTGSGEFPQIDEIIAIDRGTAAESLQNQVDLLSIAQEQSVAEIADLEDQVSTLVQSLAATEAERDDLQAQLDTGGLTDAEFLAALQAKEDQISGLQDQLGASAAQLADAQAVSQRATADLQAAQAQLQEATAALQQLEVKTLASYVDGDIAVVRNDASLNGWTLVEQPVDSPTSQPGIVTNQLPVAGSKVIRGSVVYVEFVRKP